MRALVPMLALSLSLAAQGAAAGSVHKCVDATGKAQFTDKPCDDRPAAPPLKTGVAPVSEEDARVEGGTLTVYGARASTRGGSGGGVRGSRPAPITTGTAGGGGKSGVAAASGPNGAAKMVEERSGGQVPAKK